MTPTHLAEAWLVLFENRWFAPLERAADKVQFVRSARGAD